jgi:dihydrofolate reductase
LYGTLCQRTAISKAARNGISTSTDEGPVKDYINALPKLVASRTITSSDWNNTRVTSDIGAEIARLKQTAHKDIYCFGSAELVHSLRQDGHVDEIMLCVVPVLLGAGTQLFKPGSRQNLALKESRLLTNGALIVRYAMSE